MGIGKFLKKVARVALPVIGTAVAPGIGTALGSTLSGAALSGIGGALGGGLGGAVSGGGLKGALTGAALGGAGGYLAGGGLDSLLSSTGLSGTFGSGLGYGTSADGLAVGKAYDAAGAAAARSAASTAASTASRASLPWLSAATGGGAAAGGGSAGGFFSGLGDTIKQGIGDTMSTKNVIGGLGRTGLAYALSKDNAGGLGALQAAGNQSAADYQPFLRAGTAAQGRLADLYGQNGAVSQQAALDAFRADPGYRFAVDEGTKALDASAARRGMLLSGNQVQAVQERGQGLADQMFQQYLANLEQQAGVGMDAASGVDAGRQNAALAYAALKRQKADRYNQAVGGLASWLLPEAA